jgi:signal transduction histidine kinase
MLLRLRNFFPAKSSDHAAQAFDRANYIRPLRTSLSLFFGRSYLALLAALWFLLAMSVEMAGRAHDLSQLESTPPYVLLAVITIVAILVAHAYVRRVRAYETARECERLLFAYARDGMLLVRVLRGRGELPKNPAFIIEAENPAAVLRLNAFKHVKSYIGSNVENVFPAWLLEKTTEVYSACVTTRSIQRYEVCLPDGTPTHESIANPVFDASGEFVTHIIVIMRDIGERVIHERELADALALAEAANKAKSTFLASMSHELRTPLNAVIGYSELLSHGIGGPLADKQREYIQYIHQSGGHLLNIITDILDLSKIEAGQFVLHDETIRMGQLIDDCILMVRQRAVAKGLQLAVTIPHDLPALRADPLRMKQIIINLLSNAVKFTEHGVVSLGTRYDDVTGFTLDVSDTGIGMTSEEAKVALKPFGQAEGAYSRNHDGTGLGLPIALHLAELHGGHLTIASESAVGTTVTVTIPPVRAVTSVSMRLAGGITPGTQTRLLVKQ